MTKKHVHMLQGMFFQEKQVPDIAYAPRDGATVVLREVLTSTMFMGMIWGKSADPEGYMGDDWVADLFDTSISDSEVNFIKKYRHREDRIRYSFQRKEANVWQGRWEIEGYTIRGLAWCILTQVDMALTDPLHLQKIFAK